MTPYAGPAIGCGWCAYETDGSGPVVTSEPQATHVIETPQGPRQVCALHAARGRWENRARRVGRVAS